MSFKEKIEIFATILSIIALFVSIFTAIVIRK
jgi:hypothetical protein